MDFNMIIVMTVCNKKSLIQLPWVLFIPAKACHPDLPLLSIDQLTAPRDTGLGRIRWVCVWGLKPLCNQYSSGWKSVKSNGVHVCQSRKQVVQKWLFGDGEELRRGLDMPLQQQAPSCRTGYLSGLGLHTT